MTGASSGIGAAVAAALVEAGATVIGTSRNPAGATHAPGFDLLPLELASPASVDAFSAAVADHPAVVARGGLDILVNNAGRAVLGTVGPPNTIADYPAWIAGVWRGLQTDYLGTIRVTNGLWPLLQARAKVEDGGGGGLMDALKKEKKDNHYARVVFTVSPLAWSNSAASPFLWAYSSAQRALLTYANNLRAAVTSTPFTSPPSAASKVKLSVLAPMATATRLVEGARPIFLDPAAGAGDPAFAAFLADLRAATAAGLDPAWVARAYLQVLREDEPVREGEREGERAGKRGAWSEREGLFPLAHPLSLTHTLAHAQRAQIANAAIGAPTGTLPPTVTAVPGAPTDRVAPQAAPFAEVLTAENENAAVTAVPPKAGAAVVSGIPEKLQGLQAVAGGQRRLASTIKDDAAEWVEEERKPCLAVPVLYPTPKFDAAAAAARLAGSVAVVVGASGPPNKGVGRALADQLTAAGVTVIGTSRTPADPANAGIAYDLLQLDMTDQASVEAFAAAVAAHPAVRARGLGTVFLNAARFAAGAPGPPPLQDPQMFYEGIETAQQTNFIGPLRVTHGLWPLLEAFAARPGPKTPAAPRIIFTGSAEAYAIGGADPLSFFYWSYASSKRASLSYYDSLRAVQTAGGKPSITTAALYPFAIDTRLVQGTRPAFLSPVDAAGDPVGDPYFKLIMATYRFFLSNALDPSFVAAADLELATEADPPANVAASSWAWKPPGEGRLSGQQDLWSIIHQIEEIQSAFPFEAAKRDAGEKP